MSKGFVSLVVAVVVYEQGPFSMSTGSASLVLALVVSEQEFFAMSKRFCLISKSSGNL